VFLTSNRETTNENEERENMAAALPLQIYLSEGQRSLREWRNELASRIPEWARRVGQNYDELVNVWSEVQRSVELIMGRAGRTIKCSLWRSSWCSI